MDLLLAGLGVGIQGFIGVESGESYRTPQTATTGFVVLNHKTPFRISLITPPKQQSYCKYVVIKQAVNPTATSKARPWTFTQNRKR